MSYAQTDMLIHVVNNETNTIMDVERFLCGLFIVKPSKISGTIIYLSPIRNELDKTFIFV